MFRETLSTTQKFVLYIHLRKFPYIFKQTDTFTRPGNIRYDNALENENEDAEFNERIGNPD